MDNLSNLLNFTNEDGTVKTFFDGRVTASQLVAIILAIIAVVVVMKILKGIVRTAITVGVIVVALVHFGICQPAQVKDATTLIAQQGIQTYQKYADSSDNIQVDAQNKDIKIKVGNQWVSTNDIQSIVTGDATVSITVNDTTISVDDKQVVEMLKTMSSGNPIQQLLNIYK